MIDRASLPTISETLRLLGVEPKRRRSRCPIHGGDNPQALSYDEESGVWYCHRCGAGGDVITLVMRTRDLDCRGAMQWLGITPGRPPVPDPASIRRQRARAGLAQWARRIGRELRYEYYVRELVVTRALDRLRRDAEDVWGWSWLAWALTGQAQIEHDLDMIDTGSEAEKIRAYREWRAAA